ncbi:hypothetical protein [Nonomuraea sp. CA-141351]|uniref:hypothetical protein n=1 Tax=Nonomuraea sp. CA-141351 TaxID=3239996 RepID=UPI003D8DEC32
MDYAVQVEVTPAQSTLQLDEFQRRGLSALLSRGLSSVEQLNGPDGVELDLIDFQVATSPRGALLVVARRDVGVGVREDGVRHLIEAVLERSELLADWLVVRCEVGITDEALHAGLALPDEFPSHDDLAEHAAAGAGRAQMKPECDEERGSQIRAALTAEASRLKAFGLEHFGHYGDKSDDTSPATQENATLAAGALMAATDILIGHLMDDAETQSLTRLGAHVSPLGCSSIKLRAAKPGCGCPRSVMNSTRASRTAGLRLRRNSSSWQRSSASGSRDGVG